MKSKKLNRLLQEKLDKRRGSLPKYKKGDRIAMLFHCAGATTAEYWPVETAHRDGTVTLENGRRFSLKDGRCLNDDTTFGAKRSLKLEEATDETNPK